MNVTFVPIITYQIIVTCIRNCTELSVNCLLVDGVMKNAIIYMLGFLLIISHETQTKCKNLNSDYVIIIYCFYTEKLVLNRLNNTCYFSCTNYYQEYKIIGNISHYVTPDIMITIHCM